MFKVYIAELLTLCRYCVCWTSRPTPAVIVIAPGAAMTPLVVCVWVGFWYIAVAVVLPTSRLGTRVAGCYIMTIYRYIL